MLLKNCLTVRRSLSGNRFYINKTKMLEKENKDDCFMQAVTALDTWTNVFGDEANREAIIRAMYNIGCRSQAEDVLILT